MTLYEVLLLRYFEEHHQEIDELKLDTTPYVELKAYETLKQIKRVLENDELSDKDCFQKIEEIVNLFDELGSGCGNRHDFG